MQTFRYIKVRRYPHTKVPTKSLHGIKILNTKSLHGTKNLNGIFS